MGSSLDQGSNCHHIAWWILISGLRSLNSLDCCASISSFQNVELAIAGVCISFVHSAFWHPEQCSAHDQTQVNIKQVDTHFTDEETSRPREVL